MLRRAAQVVRAGGVIAYPTEAVFGLGCDPGCDEALHRILSIKARPGGAGFILIAADWMQLHGWIAPTAAEAASLRTPAAAPTTWVVTAGPRASTLVTGGRHTIAVRVTQHPIATALCNAAGMALVSTSANRHGRRPARTALEARRWFGAEIDYVVTGAVGGLARPTEIREAVSGRVVRAG